MGLLVLLTLLVIATSVAVTSGVRSRSEAVITGSLAFNAIVVFPIYALGLTSHLDRLTLGVSVCLECAVLLGIHGLRHGEAGFRGLPRRILVLALLPLEGIRKTWQKRSLLVFGAILAAGLFPYMLLVAYLAPSFRDWDGAWYHESLVGFTIQNHGFKPEPLPLQLQVINGTQRLAEMTQVWFAMYGGRRVVDMANVFFMPLFAAGMFALVRRYTREVVSAVAWASAMLLMPGQLRLIQSSLVDPQSAALLLAAAYFVTHPQLDRKNGLWAILAMTLAVGAKVWSIVPVGLLSLIFLVRIVRQFRKNGGFATLGIVVVGVIGVVGMQATTYVRNLINFKNPFWPMLAYDNPKLGIHWAGGVNLDLSKARGGVDINDTFPIFVKKMLAAPYVTMGPGHYWQVNDYGFAWAWVVLPVLAFTVAVLSIRWLAALFAVTLRLRTRSPGDEAMSSAMMLAFVATISVYLSPAVFIARYHVASMGMLVACLAWMVSRWRTTRLSEDVALFAQIGSFMMAFWGPQSTRWIYLYEPRHIWHWITTPYPLRELEDIGTPEVPHLLVSPVSLVAGLAREKEIKAGDVVAYDYIDYVSTLWNNDYSNTVLWVHSADPLGEAESKGAKWIYTRGGTTLSTQLARAGAQWEPIGPMEIEAFGTVYRKKP